MFSRPVNAATNITNVDLGKWKLVINASTTVHLYPGFIKMSVQPESSRNSPLNFEPIVSKVRIDVVPVAIIRPPFALTSFNVCAASADS